MRPYIICHMMASLDGRIDCDMTEQIDDTNHYYEALDELDCPSTLEGKRTLSMHYAEERTFWSSGTPYKDAGRQVFKAIESDAYAVGVDTSGTLLWGDDTADQFGKPLLMILSEWASQDYLDYLKMKTISYITVGREGRLEEDPNLPGAMVGKGPEKDLEAAMEILHDEFGIKRLAVVGGGHINGSMLDLGLIDEVSMMYGYGIDGREGMAAAFDGRLKNRKPVRLTFKSVKEQDGIVWMRYLVNK